MGKYSPKKKIGIAIGTIVGFFVLIGIASGHPAQPSVTLNSGPANTVQDSSESDSNNSTEPDDTANTSDTNAEDDSASTDNTGLSDSNLSNDSSYTNTDGTTVHSPADSTDGSVPTGATAQCVDGTYSFSQHHSGTCSYHGGVATWL